MTWTYVGAPLLNVNIDAPVAGPYRMERPKIFQCPGTGKWSMWFHCDTPGFSMRSVGVLTAESIEGPYTFASPCFRPDGLVRRWGSRTALRVQILAGLACTIALFVAVVMAAGQLRHGDLH